MRLIVPLELAGRLVVGRFSEAVIEHKAPKEGSVTQLEWAGDTISRATVKVTEVWSHNDFDHLIVFKVLAFDQPQFLHKNVGMPHTHSSALAPKGHAVEIIPKSWERMYSELGRERFAATRATENAQKDVDRLIAQLKHLKARARSGEDVSLEIRSIQKTLDKKNRKAA